MRLSRWCSFAMAVCCSVSCRRPLMASCNLHNRLVNVLLKPGRKASISLPRYHQIVNVESLAQRVSSGCHPLSPCRVTMSKRPLFPHLDVLSLPCQRLSFSLTFEEKPYKQIELLLPEGLMDVEGILRFDYTLYGTTTMGHVVCPSLSSTLATPCNTFAWNILPSGIRDPAYLHGKNRPVDIAIVRGQTWLKHRTNGVHCTRSRSGP